MGVAGSRHKLGHTWKQGHGKYTNIMFNEGKERRSQFSGREQAANVRRGECQHHVNKGGGGANNNNNTNNTRMVAASLAADWQADALGTYSSRVVVVALSLYPCIVPLEQCSAGCPL